jgi:hypothetical protein
MGTQVNKNVSVEAPSEPVKKAWKKPVLDILDLQSAEYGHFTTPDGSTKHHSQ